MDQDVLTSVLSALDSINRRNKNQHGSSLWWRQFAALRRCLRKTAIDQDLGRRDLARERVRFLSETLVPKCYTAFGHVVADGQFAPLGAVLVAMLARVHRVVTSAEARRREIEAPAVKQKTKASTLQRQRSPEIIVASSKKQRLERKAEAKPTSKPKDSIDAIFAGLL